MAKAKVVTTLRLDEATYEKIVAIAEAEVRSVNNQIEYAIMKFIEAHETNSQNPDK